MRQIFTSQRLETVEGVARLLEEAGIPVHISKPRSYRSGRSGQFSYSEPESSKTQSAVWVRLPEDQPRAREVLRRAGLLASTRSYADMPPTLELPRSRFAADGSRWGWRLRIALLVVIAGVAMFIWLRRPEPAPAAPPATTPAPQTEAGEEEDVRIRISPPPAS